MQFKLLVKEILEDALSDTELMALDFLDRTDQREDGRKPLSGSVLGIFFVYPLEFLP